MKKTLFILSILMLFVSCRKDTIFNGNGIYCVANNVGFYMVAVEGGTYYKGVQSDNPNGFNYDADAPSSSHPVENVTVEDFYIGEIEVSQELWEAVMENNPSYYEDKGDDKPVNKVEYSDCIKFINKLNELTNMNFRLPTEDEWEYAARGGNKSKGYLYSGSDNIDRVAWWSGNSKNSENVKKIQISKTKRPNELGIFDMSGNVSEYCTLGTTTSGYSCRGGNYTSSKTNCKVYYGTYYESIYNMGLRLAITPSE